MGAVDVEECLEGGIEVVGPGIRSAQKDPLSSVSKIVGLIDGVIGLNNNGLSNWGEDGGGRWIGGDKNCLREDLDCEQKQKDAFHFIDIDITTGFQNIKAFCILRF